MSIIHGDCKGFENLIGSCYTPLGTILSILFLCAVLLIIVYLTQRAAKKEG